MSCDCHLFVDKLLLTEALISNANQRAESTGALVAAPRCAKLTSSVLRQR
jgi:hypothetical protein